jgi:hypothetical protein
MTWTENNPTWKALQNAQIVDLSYFANAIIEENARTVAMVIPTERGPVNYPAKITSMEMFKNSYGRNHNYSTDVAYQTLSNGCPILMVRVCSGASTPACTKTVKIGHHYFYFRAANPGQWGNSLSANIESRSNGLSKIVISYDEQIWAKEFFCDVSSEIGDERYLVNFINERSRLVRVVSLRPEPNIEVKTEVSFYAGRDEPLIQDDYIGNQHISSGMYALDRWHLPIYQLFIPVNPLNQELLDFCLDRGIRLL